MMTAYEEFMVKWAQRMEDYAKLQVRSLADLQEGVMALYQLSKDEAK